MNKFFNSSIGRLRLLAILEGMSLLVLVFISLPLKYIFGITQLSAVLGPIHGMLFLLFIFNTLSVATAYGWKFKQTTWKLLYACILPFGTFYIDQKMLKPIHKSIES